MPLLLIAWLTTAGAAGPADDAPDPPVSGPRSVVGPTARPEVRFDDARDRYLRGDVEGARDAFRAVAEDLDGEEDEDRLRLWAESLVFLGEIAYLDGSREAADASFRLVAQRLPDYRPSPYDHPDEVVGAYEIARSAVAARRPIEPVLPTRTPMPWWGYAPFGVPQFKQGRPVRGAVYATLQIGAAAASIGAWVAIDQELKDFDQLDDNAQGQARQRATLMRNAWSIPTAAAFYVLWGVSALDGGLTWRKDQRIPSQVAVVPLEGGAGVQAAWRF